MPIKSVESGDFESRVVESAKPVLVDFWAPWCGPCKMLAPILEQLADEYDGKLDVVKVDVDTARDLAQKYNVRGVPTLILMKDGVVQGTRVGVSTKSQLKTFIGDL